MAAHKIPGLGTSSLVAAELKRRAARIRLLALDVDGVLTDGGMYYGPSGEELKRFDTRDGQGIVLAMRAGLEVAFITREGTPFARVRAEKLGVARCALGVKDKAAELDRLCAELGIDPSAAAYVGDDTYDKPCIAKVGIFFTPSDGWLTFKDGVHVVLERGGGRGAVRQAINYLLSVSGRVGSRTDPGRPSPPPRART
jgi:3-deoxy-D-manno-octulosonate 8-phosphate phosphatase (KDO 8-P phosphatase)